ncbi:MAG TPA: BrnT family toxin [Candidatus Binataceae bacterium]|nr:BrnT family toxin [Candidatus Binataceae bacterium]
MPDEPDEVFEWDEAKSLRNKLRRGFDFGYASRIFAGNRFERADLRRSYGEMRIVSIGKVDDDVLTVVYTWRGNRLRIISARQASRRERDAYRTAYPETDYEERRR